MKKSLILIAACCKSSCHRKRGKNAETGQELKQEHPDNTHECQMTEEQKAMIQDWKNWNNLDDARKTELLNKGKECYDRYELSKTQREADKAKFEAQMKNWDNLSIEEKKAAFDLITSQYERLGNKHCQSQRGGNH